MTPKTAGEIGEGLSVEERKALLIAIEATYRPGTVAAQTHFHGKPNKKGEEAYNMLSRLQREGLLRWNTEGGDRMIGTVSQEFVLTDLGRAVAQELQKRGGGE